MAKKKNVTRLVSCDGRPSSPCAKTTPVQATPTRQALAAATPPASPREAKRPLTPFATSWASRAVLESSLRTHIPGVTGVNFREQKSCLQTMQNFGAQRLRYCHKPGLKLSLRGGCPGRSRLRGRLPTPRSTDFSAAPGLLFPRLRADKSHACTRANETGRQQKPPDPPPNKEKEGKKASSIGEEKSERSAREPGFPHRRPEHAPTPLRTSPQARSPSRVAYCARRTGAVTASARQVVRVARSRLPCARSPAGAERFVPSGSRGGGNRLVTS